jgi:hypothetical protein
LRTSLSGMFQTAAQFQAAPGELNLAEVICLTPNRNQECLMSNTNPLKD